LLPTGVWPADKKVIGIKEKVIICPGNLGFKAKIDTGARHSSLNVTEAVEFQREGKKWVRFKTVNQQGRSVTLERPVVRIARIKEHNAASQKRFVIKLGICLGEYYREVQCNLSDRKGFDYKILIGRSFIKGVFVVDVAREYVATPNCAGTCKADK
jgi:hypothetical protein